VWGRLVEPAGGRTEKRGDWGLSLRCARDDGRGEGDGSELVGFGLRWSVAEDDLARLVLKAGHPRSLSRRLGAPGGEMRRWSERGKTQGQAGVGRRLRSKTLRGRRQGPSGGNGRACEDHAWHEAGRGTGR
jgi:hypothetical protein